MKNFFKILILVVSISVICIYCFKVYATGANHTSCKMIESVGYPRFNLLEYKIYTSYYYTDEGEKALFTIASKNLYDKIKVEFLDTLNSGIGLGESYNGPMMSLYDKFDYELLSVTCKKNDDYYSCKERYPVHIKSYLDMQNNKVLVYKIGNSDKLRVRNLYIFNPKGQKTEERHLEKSGSLHTGFLGYVTTYDYNSNEQIKTEYIKNYYDKKHLNSEAYYMKPKSFEFRKNYIYENNNLIKKEVECIKCSERAKNIKYYEIYKYDKYNNLISKDIYLPYALDSYYVNFSAEDKDVKLFYRYEYDNENHLIKETKYEGKIDNSHLSYSTRYKYDKYGNKTAIYRCEDATDKNCYLSLKYKYKCE